MFHIELYWVPITLMLVGLCSCVFLWYAKPDTWGGIMPTSIFYCAFILVVVSCGRETFKHLGANGIAIFYLIGIMLGLLFVIAYDLITDGVSKRAVICTSAIIVVGFSYLLGRIL